MPGDDRTDEELAADYRASGDVRCVDTLVRRHIASVRAMIYPMVLNDADADDLTQQVFLRAAGGLGRFRGQALFSTWLYRIAVNTTRSFLSRNHRQPVTSPDDLAEIAYAAAAGPREAAMATEDGVEIAAALASLSPSLRTALTLTAIQGMSVRDAAALDGCLAATMYWRVHEARRLMRKKLGRLVQA